MESTISEKKHELFPIITMACLFVVIHSLALLLTSPFNAAGMQVTEDVNDPINVIYIFSVIIVMTLFILVAAKYGLKKVIQGLILFAVGYTSFYVFIPILGLVIGWWWPLIISISLSVSLVVVLYKYPEWYIIDLCGIVVGAGAIALLGISLGIFLIIIFLIVLALYDAISVYKTKHMIELADTVMDLKLPVLLVIPKIRKYSLLKETKRLKEQLEQNEERDAFFMGLGDVVMPGILVVATYFTIPNGLPIAFSVMIGTLVGFAILMTFVIKGKPQAGLPCLNGGAITGYLISSILLTGGLAGLTLPF